MPLLSGRRAYRNCLPIRTERTPPALPIQLKAKSLMNVINKLSTAPQRGILAPNGDHFLFNGLGAGNIGDEAMFEGWTGIHPPSSRDVIEVWNPASVPAAIFNSSLAYTAYNQPAVRDEHLRRRPRVLLVGDTPVMEMWGLEWPLAFHSACLKQCFDHGAVVHAIGVGVDRITGAEARSLFSKQHSRITDWTVRSEACRASLLDLGRAENSVRVAADLAWLFHPEMETRAWAQSFLRSMRSE